MLYKHPHGFRLLLAGYLPKDYLSTLLGSYDTSRRHVPNRPDESVRSVLPGSSAGSWHYAPHCDNTNRPDSEQYEPDDLHDDDRTTPDGSIRRILPATTGFRLSFPIGFVYNVSPCPTNRVTSLFRRPNRTRCRSSGYREPFRRRSSLPDVSL